MDADDNETNLWEEPFLYDPPLVWSPVLIHHNLEEFRLIDLSLGSVIVLFCQDLTEIRESVAFLKEAATINHLHCDNSIMRIIFFLASKPIIPVLEVINISYLLGDFFLKFIFIDNQFVENQSDEVCVERNFQSLYLLRIFGLLDTSFQKWNDTLSPWIKLREIMSSQV